MYTNTPSKRLKAVTVFFGFSILPAMFYPAYSITCRPDNVTSAHNCGLVGVGGGEPPVCQHTNTQNHSHSNVKNHRHRHTGNAHRHNNAHVPTDTVSHKHQSGDACN